MLATSMDSTVQKQAVAESSTTPMKKSAPPSMLQIKKSQSAGAQRAPASSQTRARDIASTALASRPN